MPHDAPSAAGLPLPEAGATLVWYAAADGSLIAENTAWQDFTGQHFEQYRGWGWLDAVHPDEREATRRAWQAAVRSEVPFHAHCRLRRHDGQYRQVSTQAAPVLDHGVLSQWVGFLSDDTERLHTATALRASEERLRLLDEIGHATRALRDPDGIMACTTRLLGEHLGASRCAYADVDADNDRFTIRADWSHEGVASSVGVYSLDLFGPRASALMRQGISLVVHDVDREIGDDGGARMFNAIGIKAIICAGLVKDGRLVAMMAVHQDQPRHWSEEEQHTVAEVVDRCWAHIERTRDAALLREQDARKDEFIATLAHELRNPLAPIKYAVALATRQAPPPAVGGKLAVIDRQVSLMSRLIDDLLDISRINRGLIELQREPAELHALVERSVEAALSLIEARQHRIDVQVPEDMLVDVDPTRIVQVVGNLITNAAKYTPVGGRIEVQARAVNGRAILTVTDNGLGIPAAGLGQLFQMFSQLRHTTGHAQGGLGLGLALVRRLVELHGGRVSASSAGAGWGSVFTVELPLAAVAGCAVLAATGGKPAPEPMPEALSAHELMVVEDNDDGRENLVELLRSLGFRVHAAANGPDALEAGLRLRPALVLLDLGLPGMDGVQVAQALRRRFGKQDMALVALTGWGSAGDLARTREAGFDGHLTKPVEIETLVRTVRQALEAIAP